MQVMAARTLSCPHCGLVLTIKSASGGTQITYDPSEWRRLCKHPALDSPALCLLEAGSGGSGSPGPRNRGMGH
jgi:hypothetical protein